MRSAVGLFGVLCGGVVIWTVGNYGYASADDPSARWNIAFLFAVIAAGGLFGHAVSIRLWSINRACSVLAGLVCGAALVINLSNSLGALAARNSRSSAEAISKASAIRDDRTELTRLQKELERLGSYIATDKPAVDAAQRAADAATTAKERECGNGDPKQRGRFCREKEDEERQAADGLAKATAAKALTDRAFKLEADMRPIRERIRTAGPVVAGNVQGSAIAKLFRLPDAEAEFAATVQQFALAGVVEALIVLSMIAFELLGNHPQRPRSAHQKSYSHTLDRPTIALATRSSMPGRWLGWWTRRRSAGPVPIAPERPGDPQVLKLVSVREARPAGSIPKILTAALDPAVGERVEFAEVYRRYRSDCAAEGSLAVSPEQFADPLKRFCKGAGIRTKAQGEHLYLLNVRIGGAHSDPQHATTSDMSRVGFQLSGATD
jgi:hypothetical protein